MSQRIRLRAKRRRTLRRQKVARDNRALREAVQLFRDALYENQPGLCRGLMCGDLVVESIEDLPDGGLRIWLVPK